MFEKAQVGSAPPPRPIRVNEMCVFHKVNICRFVLKLYVLNGIVWIWMELRKFFWLSSYKITDKLQRRVAVKNYHFYIKYGLSICLIKLELKDNVLDLKRDKGTTQRIS